MLELILAECNKLPPLLQTTTGNALTEWLSQLNQADLDLPNSNEFITGLVKTWACSQFVAESCQRKLPLLPDLASGDLFKPYTSQQFAEKLTANPSQTDINYDIAKHLRQFRNREMVRIAWRDLAGWANLTETLTELSWLADSCIQYALDYLYQQLCVRYGTPTLINGEPQQIVVLGMGKLGAYELNYSSDIDLIFAYKENGVLPDRKATTYGEFFTQLCRQLIKTLGETTADGFVFRTDIRLRPFGDSGAIIMTFEGMENYYQTQAREWERYAMIKARQVAGDFTTGKQLMAMLTAFTYRRYLDYGAFEELRSLKLQISQELKRKDRLENVKLGPGGIREIEFIGQAFQLIRGGSEKKLQIRGILDVLKLLAELSLLPKEDALQLAQSYHFLRLVENHIQEYQDKQTHDLPTNPVAQEILAYSLGYADWTSFKQDLDQVRIQVQQGFDQVFSVSKQSQRQENSQKIWACIADDQELLPLLASYNCQQPESLTAIRHFKNSNAIKRMTTKGFSVLNRLIPELLQALPDVSNPDETLKRSLQLFEAVAGRNVYLSLLAENPQALKQLLRLLSASPWFTDYLAQYPILFDELLDARSLFVPLNRTKLDEQLAEVAAPIAVDDEEKFMTALREFKHQSVLKVAAADIMGIIPLMVVSDYLTWIAEAIVHQVLLRSWAMLVAKHGLPPECQGTAHPVKGFAIIGFGKLGGIELGYGSDLDMVFLYHSQDGNAATDGDKPLSCSQFYGRLALKIRHILDSKLLSGILYEVDLRLRPHGNSGLLATNLDYYENYLTKEAWTWEHQALVRGRFITGDAQLKNAYEAIRYRVLSLPRDQDTLKTEVRDMRQKMREALATKETDKFDLKQSKGGIADIEFIVQFALLAHAAQYPALTTYTDNIRQLDSLQAQGILPADQVSILKSAYCTYRDYGHKLTLQGDRAIMDEAGVTQLKTDIEGIWCSIMG